MTDIRELKRRVANGKCEVLGLGISNLPLCRVLAKWGAKIYGRDKKSEDELGVIAKELKNLNITLITGAAYLLNIGGNDPSDTVIFRSPGLHPNTKEIEHAVSKGAILTSEMDLFLALTPTMIVGVTGSDGKTTTTTLIGEFLKKEFEYDKSGRRVFVGGNIGEPLLPKLNEMRKEDVAVVELSSFQLMTSTRSPERAVITNISPNHLNWHADMKEYIEAKKNICKYESCQHLTVNNDNKETAIIGREFNANVTFFSSTATSHFEIEKNQSKKCSAVFIKDGNIYFSDGVTDEQILEASSIKIPGKHNIENYMAAISATFGLVSKKVIKEVAENFSGVEHRCELVRCLNGVTYYNSSIDSTPSRTTSALSVFKQKVIIICGGYDKNIPFEPLAEALCKKAKAVIIIGATAQKIKSAILSCPSYCKELFELNVCNDLSEAVYTAKDIAKSGDVVILSPACASFDAFKNFEERGNKFKEVVNSLK